MGPSTGLANGSWRARGAHREPTASPWPPPSCCGSPHLALSRQISSLCRETFSSRYHLVNARMATVEAGRRKNFSAWRGEGFVQEFFGRAGKISNGPFFGCTHSLPQSHHWYDAQGVSTQNEYFPLNGHRCATFSELRSGIKRHVTLSKILTTLQSLSVLASPNLVSLWSWSSLGFCSLGHDR